MKRHVKSATPADRGRIPGSLCLRLVGFGKQNLVTADEVAEAIDSLPSFHLEGLHEICFEQELPQVKSEYVSGQRIARIRYAEFIQHQRRIILFPNDNRPLFWQVLLHEIGHHVFFSILDSVRKKHWVTELHPNYFCVSEYATQDAREDFAESYAAYVLAPDVLGAIPAKFEFMRDQVFSGNALDVPRK